MTKFKKAYFKEEIYLKKKNNFINQIQRPPQTTTNPYKI